jgi:hypothetical protein
MPVYSPEVIARKHRLSGMSLREIERQAPVSAARLCKYMRGLVALRPEQLRTVNLVLEAAIRDRAAEMAHVLEGEAAMAG